MCLTFMTHIIFLSDSTYLSKSSEKVHRKDFSLVNPNDKKNIVADIYYLLICIRQSPEFFFTWIISFDPHHRSPRQVL